MTTTAPRPVTEPISTSTSPSPSTQPLDLAAAMAEDLKLADHCYQLALANGDPRRIKAALAFWHDCMADYDQQFRRQRQQRQRQQRRNG